MDHYIYRMQQGKRGTQAHAKPKAKVDWKISSLQATLSFALWLLMAALAASLELWSAERKFENFLDSGSVNKDSVKIVIGSHYLLSNVDFHSEIRFEKFLDFKRQRFCLFFLSQMRTSTPKKPASSSSHLPVVNSELFEAHPTSDHDSAEEDNDYYFSDE